MKSRIIIASRCRLVFCAALLVTAAASASAQTSIFTYQGRLTDGGNPANGTYEMQFKVFDAATVGLQQPQPTPITLTFTVAGSNPVSVVNGVFTVQLNFGNIFPGADRWLEISVRKPTDPPGFTLLTPRQQITSSPYSIRTLSATTADSAPAGTLTGTTLNGTVTGSSLTSVGTLTNLTVTNPIAGSVTGNAATATALQTGRTINGATFDGTANITVTAAAGTLTGTTLNATVTGSSLTSVGTLSNLTVTNPIAGSVTGNAANVTGTVAVANGGTGAGNAGGARTNLGLGTLATLSPTGTANSTTFLRGDNAWAVPTAAANNTFFNAFANSSAAGTTFTALSGGTSPQATLGAVANLMAGPCTVDALYVAGTITGSAAADTLTLTMIKNGSATALTTVITVNTLNATVTNSDTTAGHSFTVAAGDAVAIQIVQTNGAPVVRLATTVHCQ